MDEDSVIADCNWQNRDIIEIDSEKAKVLHASERIRQRQQEFLNLVLEAAKTGDKSKLAAWWRERFPGYKMWLFGPDFQVVLPDDGRDE